MHVRGKGRGGRGHEDIDVVVEVVVLVQGFQGLVVDGAAGAEQGHVVEMGQAGDVAWVREGVFPGQLDPGREECAAG